MNEEISVKAALGDYKAGFKSIGERLYAFETAMKQVKSLMQDSGKWSGDTHDRAQEIHGMVMQYFDRVKPIFGEVETCVAALNDHVDSFAGTSRNVTRIK